MGKAGERAYHLLWGLLPASRQAIETFHSVDQAISQLRFQELLCRWERPELERSLETLMALLDRGSSWELACFTLRRRLRLTAARLRRLYRPADRRHREGLCNLFGTACPALGGLAEAPWSPEEGAWRTFRQLWREARRFDFAFRGQG